VLIAITLATFFMICTPGGVDFQVCVVTARMTAILSGFCSHCRLIDDRSWSYSILKRVNILQQLIFFCHQSMGYMLMYQ
jgi:hypothetical protein